MTEALSLTGKCMCGAVKIIARADKPDVTVCHCVMCQRWSAGPSLEVTCQDVTFEGDENIGRIRSSEWAERGFCTKCGSNLFYQAIDSDELQVSAGLFDDQSKLRMSLQLFTDSQPQYYEFANKTKMMTGAEVFAAYAPPPD